MEANRLADDAETRGALLSLAEDASPVRTIIHGSWSAAAISAGGRTVAAVGVDGIAVVDLNTRESRWLSRSNYGDVSAVAFSHDDRLLALGGDGNAIEILDATSGKAVLPPLRFPKPRPVLHPFIKSIRFNPDDSSVAAISQDEVGVVWSLPNGRELGRFSFLSVVGQPCALAFSTDGRWLAVSGNGGLLLDAHTLRPRYPRPALDNYRREFDIAFAPDGNHFAVATDEDSTTLGNAVVIRDSASGAFTNSEILTGSTSVSKIAYSADGRTIAGALSNGTVAEWSTLTGDQRRTALSGLTRPPLTMSFTNRGLLVAVSTAEIVVFDPASQLAEAMLPGDPSFTDLNAAIAISGDGRTLFVADGYGRVRIWDTASGRLLRTIAAASSLGPGATDVAEQPGTNTIVVSAGDGTVSAWDKTSGRREHAPIRMTEPNPYPGLSRPPGRGVLGIDFDATGHTLVAASADGQVAIIDPKTWTVRRTFRLIDNALYLPHTISISRDGRTVALGGPSLVVISDVDGRHRRQLNFGPTMASDLAFDPSGQRLVVGLFDGRILVVDPGKATLRATLDLNHGDVSALALDSTGNTLASGGADGTVTLRTLNNGVPIGPALTSTDSYVSGLTFSPRGDRLFAAGGAVLRYDLDAPGWIDRLCNVIGRNLTSEERRAYFPDPGMAARTCPNWPIEP
jgi:WD40 repeat protein